MKTSNSSCVSHLGTLPDKAQSIHFDVPLAIVEDCIIENIEKSCGCIREIRLDSKTIRINDPVMRGDLLIDTTDMHGKVEKAVIISLRDSTSSSLKTIKWLIGAIVQPRFDIQPWPLKVPRLKEGEEYTFPFKVRSKNGEALRVSRGPHQQLAKEISNDGYSSFSVKLPTKVVGNNNMALTIVGDDASKSIDLRWLVDSNYIDHSAIIIGPCAYGQTEEIVVMSKRRPKHFAFDKSSADRIALTSHDVTGSLHEWKSRLKVSATSVGTSNGMIIVTFETENGDVSEEIPFFALIQ